MWRALPHQASEVREVRIEGTGQDHDVIIVPKAGEQLRFAAAGHVEISTVGNVIVRSERGSGAALRVIFSAPKRQQLATLERAEVEFDGTDKEWADLWRRARMRSHPWWQEGQVEELDLDWAMHARLTIASR